MKRTIGLAIVGCVAVVVLALTRVATVSSTAPVMRSFGDLTADWTVATPVVASPMERMRLASWPQADLSNSGEFLVYQRQKARNEYATQIARLPGGEVVVDSLLPPETFGGPGGQFSPDGKRIVFCAGKGRYVSPWVVNSDGTGVRGLRDDAFDYAGPAWRPDGKEVAFRRRPLDGSFEETVFLDPDTGEVLSTLKSSLQSLRFSPDGQWLIGDGPRGLTALKLSTGEERIMWDPKPLGQPGTDAAWQVCNYAWACDSRRVFFTAAHRDMELAQGPSACEIWEGNLDGPAGKIMDGQVLAGSLNGKYLLIDKRRVPSRDELSSGDVQLLTLKP